ncbi:MAG: hypothetical protein A3G52_02070 [Candidatus Taylorbacteria bacterium RIFCSPLOWO2_12_FULL_43_20]|uniref:Phosphotyrosine protein phosphatase I domain-containing protein n=1 Tax=Candidatus Taylorbacteria bacterium RIFCSPLOWO2_12_FULL_43_20 TaxID=1802332 RepID=A0A1G2P3U3_9BACT|nr:MAG: hypothetical protein A3B98_00370 [Candidatus Taylorbacteria bacterium RIFCSPHIGHO2_02_FULL_43_55]OHA39623.1 MAG: hypothetical protein A3H58_02515 [Candidatus Taylorbacteria bacterium RIFCSPLOWO2_02_FULL_43_22b]OHA43004.1 MAG: hypothetical protein A3G52_02070 [Candidatus Taylorbacteria bacterium RIFCSPLOWO2_12_FULL_43_20]
MSHLILTVCKGNIHRSVLAEACISKYLQELGLEGSFKVASRGLQGTCGTAMPKFPNMRCYSLEYGYTEPILQELEIEIPETKIATPIDEGIVQKASLILAMNSEVLCGFANCLVNQFPKFGFKMRLFSEMAGDIRDVPDCAGKTDTEMYRQVNLTIHATAKNGIQKMCQLAELLNPQTSKGE